MNLFLSLLFFFIVCISLSFQLFKKDKRHSEENGFFRKFNFSYFSLFSPQWLRVCVCAPFSLSHSLTFVSPSTLFVSRHFSLINLPLFLYTPTLHDRNAFFALFVHMESNIHDENIFSAGHKVNPSQASNLRKNGSEKTKHKFWNMGVNAYTNVLSNRRRRKF